MVRKLLLVGVVLVALLVGQQVAGVDSVSRFAQGLQNSLHGCWFAAVTWLVLGSLSTTRLAVAPRRQWMIGAGIALLLAPATELVQLFTGRDAGLGDVLLDLMGAGAALSIWSVRERLLSMRLGLSIASVLIAASFSPLIAALSVNVYRDAIAPDLVRPASPYFGALFHSTSVVTQVTAPSGWAGWEGRRVLQVDLAEERYPGAWISETIDDWRPYRMLVLEVYVVGDAALPLTVSVRFQRFREEHAYRTFDMAPGAGRVEIPLDGLFDRLRLVSDLVVHSSRAFAGRTFYVGAIRLE